MPEDKKKGKEPGGTLDAFFEPTEEEISKEKEHKYYPVDKEKVGEIKPEPELEVSPEEPKETKEGKAGRKIREKKGARAKGAGSKTVLIILGVVLGVLVLGAGGYFGGTFVYNKFLKKLLKKTEKVAQAPAKPKPKPPAPVASQPTPAPAEPSKRAEAETQSKPLEKPLVPPSAPKPAPTPVEPSPVKPAETPASVPAPSKPAKPTPSSTKPGETKPLPSGSLVSAKPSEIPAGAQPMPVPSLGLASSAPGKGWACQIEADFLMESMEEPVNSLRRLGYNNLYYVDTNRKLTIYHLYLTGAFDQKTAEQKKKSLEQIGFKPRLEPMGNQFRVIAYSYGKNSIAQGSKAKIEKAGLGPAEIIPKTGPVTLHQLRVGPYSARADAQKEFQKLRANGFSPVLLKEE